MLLKPEAISQSEILTNTENQVYQIIRSYSQTRQPGAPVEIHQHNVTIRQIAQQVMNLPESAVFSSAEYESYVNNIHVVVSNINKKLYSHGLITRSITSIRSETRYYLDSLKTIGLPVTTLGFKSDALLCEGEVLSDKLFLPLQLLYYILEFLSLQDDISAPMIFTDNDLLSFIGKAPVGDSPTRLKPGMVHLQNCVRKLKLTIMEHNLPIQIVRKYMEGELVQLTGKN